LTESELRLVTSLPLPPDPKTPQARGTQHDTTAAENHDRCALLARECLSQTPHLA